MEAFMQELPFILALISTGSEWSIYVIMTVDNGQVNFGAGFD